MGYIRAADLIRIADDEGVPLESLLKPVWTMRNAERRRLGIPTLEEMIAAAKAADEKGTSDPGDSSR